MEKLLIPAPAESIKMEVIPSGTSSKLMIHFEGKNQGCFSSEEEKFAVLLKEELQWEDLKIESVTPASNPTSILITPGEYQLLVSRFHVERIKEVEALTALTCGIKLMVGINKNALKEKSSNEVIWEILKQSPLIESARFLNFHE